MSVPSQDDVEDFLLSCRYGELDEVKSFIEQFGRAAVAIARDERGNTAIHMCCGNGHVDVLTYILPHIPPTLLSQTNAASSPPIHWAVSNNHVLVIRLLAEFPAEKGGGLPLFKQKNAAGRDAFAEALFAGEGKEEIAGWIEGFLWRVEGGDDEEGAKSSDNHESVHEEDEGKSKQASGITDDLAARTDGVRIDDS
ncbi:MAG: hypothetical protein TREMPRED_002789 [Tremellales sp. Tagirdzhanova-0007]|nr:MAG: hypothetical protein TREMPRED_002789 [Tremellales sp. Tagirdzhanova-0007]